MKLIGHGYTAMCLFVTDLALALCAVEMAGLTKPGFLPISTVAVNDPRVFWLVLAGLLTSALLWTLHIRVFRGN